MQVPALAGAEGPQHPWDPPAGCAGAELLDIGMDPGLLNTHLGGCVYRDLLPKLLFPAPRCLKMLLPAKPFSSSHVWEPDLTKPVKLGDSVEPLPAALASGVSPGAG